MENKILATIGDVKITEKDLSIAYSSNFSTNVKKFQD